MKIRNLILSAAATLALTAPAFAETLTWVSRANFHDWDPGAVYSEETYLLGNIYETLTFYEDGKVKPRLAESWVRLEDGAVWDVNLRTGVTFHDGSEMDAAAVKKSIEYIKNEGRGAAFLWAGLTGIEVVDTHQIKFSFAGPTAFDLIASGQYGSYIIAPAAVDKGHDWMQEANAIGTGPYKLVEYAPGERVLVEKHDDYWGGWAEGSFDRVIMQFVTESSTRVQMLQSGAADLGFIPSNQIELLNAGEKTAVAQGDSWRNSMFLFNVDKYPTDNLKFRQALTHLWDYESVVRDFLGGAGQLPQGPLPSTMWGAGTYEMPTFDIEKAAALLEESGIPQSDWQISIGYINDAQVYVDSAELFQALAAELGVTVNLEPNDWATLWPRAKNRETAANMTSMTWWPAYATPADWLYSQWHTEENALFNLSFYSNPAYDAAVGEFFGLEGADIEAATAKAIEAQDILMADTPAIFFADAQRYYGHSKTLNGMEHQFNPAYETLWLNKLTR